MKSKQCARACANFHSGIPCITKFHMKYTYLHINSTQQELHVDVCEKIWTYTAENPQLNPM